MRGQFYKRINMQTKNKMRNRKYRS